MQAREGGRGTHGHDAIVAPPPSRPPVSATGRPHHTFHAVRRRTARSPSRQPQARGRPVITLPAEELRALVPMADAVAAVRAAFVAVAERTIDQPQRLVSDDGLALSMMARDRETRDTVVKTVMISPENRSLGLPTIRAVVMAYDGATGAPSLLIDGTAVTALRTGAASGVATDLLARPDAAVLAVIGAGGQARDQVDAVCAVRPIREIRLASRDGRSATALAERLRADGHGATITATASVAHAVEDADVVCCATPAVVPLFDVTAVRDDVHVNAIGAFTPTMCELDPGLLARAAIVTVDQVEAAMDEAGDLLAAIAAGAIRQADLVEIGALLRASSTPRTAGISVFKSVGLAAQDFAIAQLVRERLRGTPGAR